MENFNRQNTIASPTGINSRTGFVTTEIQTLRTEVADLFNPEEIGKENEDQIRELVLALHTVRVRLALMPPEGRARAKMWLAVQLELVGPLMKLVENK